MNAVDAGEWRVGLDGHAGLFQSCGQGLQVLDKQGRVGLLGRAENVGGLDRPSVRS